MATATIVQPPSGFELERRIIHLEDRIASLEAPALRLPSEEIHSGDVVTICSGSPMLTVNDVDDKRIAHVIWFECGICHDAWIHTSALTLVRN